MIGNESGCAMKYINIYIDTSIKGPRRSDGVCQYIIAYEAANGKVADAGNRIFAEDTTENHLTIIGLRAALSRLKAPCGINLYLECSYVAAVLQNGWIQEWRYAGWMTAKGKPVQDAEVWQDIESLLCPHTFQVFLKQPHPYKEWMHRELLKYKDGRGEKREKHHA